MKNLQVLINRSKSEVKNEVSHIFTNVTDNASASQIDTFVNNGMIKFFMRVLDDEDEDDHGVFEALINVLVWVLWGC